MPTVRYLFIITSFMIQHFSRISLEMKYDKSRIVKNKQTKQQDIGLQIDFLRKRYSFDWTRRFFYLIFCSICRLICTPALKTVCDTAINLMQLVSFIVKWGLW